MLDVEIWHNALLIKEIKNFIAILSLTPMGYAPNDAAIAANDE